MSWPPCSTHAGPARAQPVLLLLLLLCGAFPCSPAVAEKASEADLSKLESRIHDKKADLAKLRAQESSVLGVLERMDKEYDENNSKLEQLNERIRILAERVATTAESTSEVSSRLATGKKALSQRAGALYKWQRGGSPFVLLAGDVSVLELMRRKRYLGIVLDHDQKLIEGLSRQTAELARLDRDLKEQRAALQEERSKVVAVRASIRRERERKKATLYTIRREANLRVQALDELERASGALQEVINRSTEVEPKAVGKDTAKVSGKSREGTPGATEAWAGFENAKGRLELPVDGTIIGGFGRRQHPDLNVEVYRKGLDIAAPEGEEIRAVASGEVIFSNRLSGYGRMVIIDHGERYYTVYAHLSKLDKSVGEHVMRGDSIGEVGDSGTFGAPRLYFEVRKDGRPVDPAPWFKPASLRAATGRLERGETRKASR